MKQDDLKNINALLLFCFGLIAGFYFAASFLVPLAFAAFLSALMTPVSGAIEKAGLGRILSSLLSTLIVFIVAGGLSYLLFYQFRLFTEDIPQLKKEFEAFYQNIQEKLASSTRLTTEDQRQLYKEHSEMIGKKLETLATNALGDVLTTSLNFLLVLIYLFLLLLYREKFADFIMAYVPANNKEGAKTVLHDTSKVVFHYLWGRIKVMAILAVLYIISFLLFDVPYPILLTIFGALITIIPYIGPLISGLLPVVLYMIVGDSFTEILFFASVILVIQLIESYLLEPIIIGSEVKLNPLTVIIAIIIGGLVWGISGMILFVPLFSIMKIIFDHSTNLRPLGILLGETNPPAEKYRNEKK